MRFVRLPRAAKGEPVFLSHTQVEQLAMACPGYETFVRVLAYTGLRWGEATAVRVKRLDLMRRRIEVEHTAVELHGEMTYGTPKTHQRRSVPLPRSLVDALANHVAGKGPDDLVFTTLRGDVMRSHNFRSRVFAPATPLRTVWTPLRLLVRTLCGLRPNCALPDPSSWRRNLASDLGSCQ